MKRLKRKRKGGKDIRRLRVIQVTIVEGTNEDTEAGRGQGRGGVDQEVGAGTGKRTNEEIVREVQTGKTENWIRAMDPRANVRKLCKRSSSGSERRRGTSTKVHGSFVIAAWGKVLGMFLWLEV